MELPQLATADILILIAYGIVLVVFGIIYTRKTKTSEQFMVAGRGIPAWAAGLAVMSAYTSSISYIAVPGKAYDENWHPMIFALAIIPVTWLVTKYVIPYYRQSNIISVYGFLEEKMGAWGRIYAALSFVLYMIGRTAVILYLAGLLLASFIPVDIRVLILAIGIVTIIYTLLGGMEAVIWTDVMQSAVMIVGIIFCAFLLSKTVFAQPDYLIQHALDNRKFGLGSLDFEFSSRTVWVMIIYGITENLRNLIADQNYVQKYASVGSLGEARRSVWTAMLIYIPLTALFLYIGSTLFAYYGPGGAALPEEITKGDQVFPWFIATQLPVGLKGLIIAAIIAAAMSTVDSALNCSATVLLLDVHKRFIRKDISEKGSLSYLRWMTVVWGVLGTIFALMMIRAQSALDIWWQISGIFGGGILGLFLLSLFRARLTLSEGLITIAVSIAVIAWATFGNWNIDPIIIGAVGTAVLLITASIFLLSHRFRNKPVK